MTGELYCLDRDSWSEITDRTIIKAGTTYIGKEFKPDEAGNPTYEIRVFVRKIGSKYDKKYSYVLRPDGIEDELFYEIMDQAESWMWWDTERHGVKNYWWGKIIDLNRHNPAFHGENSWLD